MGCAISALATFSFFNFDQYFMQEEEDNDNNDNNNRDEVFLFLERDRNRHDGQLRKVAFKDGYDRASDELLQSGFDDGYKAAFRFINCINTTNKHRIQSHRFTREIPAETQVTDLLKKIESGK